MIQPLPLPKSRLEALADGIFAVTMTLLVLDLRLPERQMGSPDDFVRTLIELIPHVDNYVISFVVLCVFWIAHLRLMRRVREVDGTFLWTTLGFLLFTTFVPPLTSYLGHNPLHPRAAILYGTNLLAILVFEVLLWRHMCRALYNESVTDPVALWRFVRSRFVIAACIVALGIAVALIEIAAGVKAPYAPYVYLLLIGASVVRARYQSDEQAEPRKIVP
jgi:uncharacterized membrane protein